MATAAAGGKDAVAARAKAAVLGSLLADAATMPLHWIYDADKVQGLLDSKGRLASPEFFPEPSCPFYSYALGRLSPYGDEEYALLQYGAAHADIDGPGLTQHLVDFFTAYDGRLNGTAKHLVEAWAAGKRFPEAAADDSQANAIVKVPVLVARYGGTAQLASRVEAAVRAQQNSDAAVAQGQAAAAILERVVVHGASVAEAIGWALQPGSIAPEVQAQLAVHLPGPDGTSARQMVWDVTKAPSCALPGALVNALFCARVSSGYVESVRANIVAAGDNCSRILFGGALWAAAEGEGALPAEWKAQVPKWAELERLTDELISHREA
ncbi:ADP-ribosylation Crystallin J1 [Chlorella sorokiniana]|uniref:ADP-ribosylation Crystallin J1 n=1 Tax=Chlorella sorokiniana TaxID=3076 RepID=A0A2P6TNG5_CHLSO|nr:ADP-ribosylation Crystallin J1 [Chlorella sorokiniana]|eukprot:PRW50877.1 ADP-ribosylation Crystallin J1 [Chlorella sorokiniana]